MPSGDSSSQAASANSQAAGAASQAAGASENPRPCSSLVGQPFHTAMSGGGVTCSLGPGGDEAIRVIARSCPDAAPFYEFYSTDTSSGADLSVYFGSQVSPLYRAGSRAITVQDMATESCP